MTILLIVSWVVVLVAVLVFFGSHCFAREPGYMMSAGYYTFTTFPALFGFTLALTAYTLLESHGFSNIVCTVVAFIISLSVSWCGNKLVKKLLGEDNGS